MAGLARNLRIAAFLAKISAQTQLQYRYEFLLQLFMSIFWVGWNVAPAWVVLRLRPNIGGFSLEQALLVLSAFLILKALLEGLVNPNLVALVEHIRTGTLDFVLLKPADSQLLVSAGRFVPSKIVDLSAGLVICIWSFARLDPSPGGLQILAFWALIASAASTLYAVWLMVACTTFWLVRIDNLSYLFTSIFDAGRWPISVFRGWLQVVLTFVIPVAAMTSFPALAAFGQLEPSLFLFAFCTSLLFILLSRRMWIYAVRHYASASS